MKTRWLLAGFLPFTIFACADSGTSSNPDGLTRVDNGPAAWTAETAWRLEEDLRLETLDESVPEQHFADIYAVLTDPDDRIYILDGQAQDIRVFDAEGTHERTIGRPGEGPGELTDAAGLNLGPDGRLWVWDTRQGFNVFGLDGTFVTRHPRRVRGVLYPWRGEFAPDGHLYDWGISYERLAENEMTGRTFFHLFRMALDFATMDTLPGFEYQLDMSGDRPVPFGAGLSVYQDRNGSIWFAHTRRYEVFRRTLEGDTTHVFTVDAEASAVTGAERESALADQAQLPAQFQIDPDDIPDKKPIVRRIFSDNSAYVYVVPEVAGVPAGSAVDVFTTDGVFQGRLDLPAMMLLPLPAPHATPTHLYVVTTDEFDVEYVSRLRIVRPD